MSRATNYSRFSRSYAMNDWPLTCIFIAFGIVTLVAWPIAAMPGLSPRTKILWLLFVLFIFIPTAIALYIWLGVPQLQLVN